MLVVQRLACSSTSTPCNARSGDAGGANLALAYQAAGRTAEAILPADQQPAVLAQALAAATAIPDDSTRAQALTRLAPYLSPDLLAQALEATPKRALTL